MDCQGCKHVSKKPTEVPCCDCARRFVDYFEMRPALKPITNKKGDD